MATYYRPTESDSPMSDWGHAMFAGNDSVVDRFGSNNWTVDPDVSECYAANINSMQTEIINAIANRERVICLGMI